jgi:glycosyltransferase involved in cell wall biosynthesis
VIIPAHNESHGLPRLLEAIVADRLPEGLDVIVVCNGCTDDTAERARGFSAVRVFEIDIASKRAAIAEGDRRAKHPTRAYIDADVVIDQEAINRLIAALEGPVLAVAPERRLDRRRVSRCVCWYYDVWERLPQVESGLFGRGVVVLSGQGHARIRSLPQVMSDDLLVSEAFDENERRVVPGTKVTIWPPRTLSDLLRRRIRVVTGNAEMDARNLRKAGSKTSSRSLLVMASSSRRQLPKVIVFALVGIVAKVGASLRIRRGDFETWMRDESSRLVND